MLAALLTASTARAIWVKREDLTTMGCNYLGENVWNDSFKGCASARSLDSGDFEEELCEGKHSGQSEEQREWVKRCCEWLPEDAHGNPIQPKCVPKCDTDFIVWDTFSRGCASARWSGGEFTKELCDGTSSHQSPEQKEFAQRCCVWKDDGCVYPHYKGGDAAKSEIKGYGKFKNHHGTCTKNVTTETCYPWSHIYTLDRDAEREMCAVKCNNDAECIGFDFRQEGTSSSDNACCINRCKDDLDKNESLPRFQTHKEWDSYWRIPMCKDDPENCLWGYAEDTDSICTEETWVTDPRLLTPQACAAICLADPRCKSFEIGTKGLREKECYINLDCPDYPAANWDSHYGSYYLLDDEIFPLVPAFSGSDFASRTGNKWVLV